MRGSLRPKSGLELCMCARVTAQSLAFRMLLPAARSCRQRLHGRDTSHEARIRDLLSAMPGAHLSPSEFPERHLMVIVNNLRVCFSLGRTMPKFSCPTTNLTRLDKLQRQ
jgi:hypothetical protein